MRKAPYKLTIPDHMNFLIEGLSPQELLKVQSYMSLPVKGAFTTAAFKAKIWDGRESLLNDSGVGFLYEINHLLDALTTIGIDLDHDIELVDERVYDFELPEPVGEDFLLKETGYMLRDYQLLGINTPTSNTFGVFDIGTNGGKTVICLGISKLFNHLFKSVVIVPSEQLVMQTYEDYKKSDLDVAVLTSKIPPNKRAAVIKNTRHIILTSKLFLTCFEYFKGERWVVMNDETHVFGDAFGEAFREAFSDSPVRLGMTASLPKKKDDPYKRNKIFAHMGGGILVSVKQHELISRGISSQLDIEVVVTKHPEVEEQKLDWPAEESYLLTNKNRVRAIAEFITPLLDRNTLILCHASFGLALGEEMGLNVIVDETKLAKRQEWFAQYAERDDHYLIGTFGCVGTGISAKRIFRMIFIDVGKNGTHTIQGIGRGLRLDGEVNAVDVIDISADLKYSSKHRKERLKLYNEEKFRWVDNGTIIEVKD